MGTNGAAKIILPGDDVAEESSTTVEIKIKTLDSQTYTMRVNRYVPVPALKDQIAVVTGVLSEQQRLICRGKVLKDDQLLSAYHVEDGHTLHLVVREPNLSSSSTSYMGPEGASDHPATDSASGSVRTRSFVFEAVGADQADINPAFLSRLISSMIDTVVTPSTGSEDSPIDLRDIGSERLARASNDNGLSDSTQSQPDPSTRIEFDRQQADMRLPSTFPLGMQNPAVIPDSLATLTQYLALTRNEFRRGGFGADGREHAAGVHHNGEQNHDSHSHPASIQSGFPTPASLAEILLSTRQLLMEQAGECQSQLARQLEGHTSVTDPVARANIQSRAMRAGVIMQNLGSLLLELGRTTMTLRMGQSPSEAVVNAGPAVFISASGPNPLMVQPVPFYPGANFGGLQTGTVNSGRGVESEPLDSAFLPRNIEIRIRTGRAAPITSANVGEQAGAQQAQQEHGQTDPARNSSGANVIRQALSGISGGESGVRVVPIRTVVAVPSGLNHSSSESSGSSLRLFYPLLARVRQPSTGNTNDVRGSQASSQNNQAEAYRQPVLESGGQRQNSESNTGTNFSVPSVFEMSPPAYDSAEPQGPLPASVSDQPRPLNSNSESGIQDNDRTARDNELHQSAGIASEPGVVFSSVLRQLMPYIPQTRVPGVSPTNASSSTAQTERENLNGSSSSQHRRDQPEDPSPKRPKRGSD